MLSSIVQGVNYPFFLLYYQPSFPVRKIRFLFFLVRTLIHWGVGCIFEDWFIIDNLLIGLLSNQQEILPHSLIFQLWLITNDILESGHFSKPIGATFSVSDCFHRLISWQDQIYSHHQQPIVQQMSTRMSSFHLQLNSYNFDILSQVFSKFEVSLFNYFER